MRDNTLSVIRHILKLPLRVSTVIVLAATLVFFPVTQVAADSFDDQIKALQQQSDQYQSQLGSLRAQADTLQNQLNTLNAQMSSLQNDIQLKQAELDKINDTIVKTQQRLDNQMTLLGGNLRAMYLEDQVTPLEMIASSKSISDFIDKQEYRNKIRDQVEKSITDIKQLKADLAKQKTDAEHVLADQKSQRDVLADTQHQQALLLSQTQGQESSYQQLVQQKSSQIAILRAQQVAANRALGGRVTPGDPHHGGYPNSWNNAPKDSFLDNWGMYTRECVSYTAYRVWASGRYMPYWGDGNGDAKYWDDKAIAAGIPVSNTPKVGDVAISNAGAYGHAMYVEAVLDNGQIYVSQYNYGFTGEYSEMTVSASGLVFIHF